MVINGGATLWLSATTPFIEFYVRFTNRRESQIVSNVVFSFCFYEVDMAMEDYGIGVAVLPR